MTFSLIKVEKVVKPPHNPAVNSRRLLVPSDANTGKPEAKPMIRQPKTFTINVAKGKGEMIYLSIRYDTE